MTQTKGENNRWVSGVKTVSTFPPEGTFTKDAETIVRVMASKKVEPSAGPTRPTKSSVISQKTPAFSAPLREYAGASSWADSSTLSWSIKSNKRERKPVRRPHSSEAEQPSPASVRLEWRSAKDQFGVRAKHGKESRPLCRPGNL